MVSKIKYSSSPIEPFSKYALYLLSIVLGWGKYEPIFNGEGAISIIQVSILLFIITMLFETKVINHAKLFRKPIILLVLIVAAIFVSSLNYYNEYSDKNIFNYKLLLLVVLFWFLSYKYYCHPQLIYSSLLLFALSCVSIAFLFLTNTIHSSGGLEKRLVILNENPNSTSVRMALAALILLYFILDNSFKSYKFRYLLLIPIPLLLNLVLLSGSRGGLGAFIIGLLIIILFIHTTKKKKIILYLVMIPIGIYFYNVVLDTKVMASRISVLIDSQSIGSRSMIWKDAINIYYDYPLGGVGEIGYEQEMMKRYSYYLDTHNIFLYLLVTGGSIALLLLIMFIYPLIINSIISLKKGNNILQLLILIFALFIASKTGGALTYTLLWYMLAIIQSYHNTSKIEISMNLYPYPNGKYYRSLLR